MVVEYSRKNSSAADIEAEVESLDDFEPVSLAEVQTEPMAPRSWLTVVEFGVDNSVWWLQLVAFGQHFVGM